MVEELLSGDDPRALGLPSSLRFYWVMGGGH
jgi:hypothetical protein